MRFLQRYSDRHELPLMLVTWPLVPGTLAMLGWSLGRQWYWAMLGVISLNLGVTSILCGLGLWGIRFTRGERDWKVPLLAILGLAIAGVYLLTGLALTPRLPMSRAQRLPLYCSEASSATMRVITKKDLTPRSVA
jgi:hypothetical protein